MMETLDVASLASAIPEYPAGDFGFLLPAFDDAECDKALALASHLLAMNCAQITCLGLKAEKLHDEIDALVEGAGKFNILTTYDVDPLEACEYFIFSAGSSVTHLVALIADHSEVVSILDTVIDDFRRDEK